MVVLVEAEAGDGMGDYALRGKSEVVGSAEELLLLVGVVDEAGTVFGKLGTKVGSVEAGEPKSAGWNCGVWAADHLELQIRDNGGEGNGRMREKRPIAEAAQLLRTEERKDDRTARSRTRSKDVRQGEHGGSAGCVVVSSVVDEIGVGVGGIWFSDTEVVEMSGEEDGFAVL